MSQLQVSHPIRTAQTLYTIIVTKITNITPTMVRGARPLSVVFTEFLEWIQTTKSEISNATNQSYYPGRISGHICMLHYCNLNVSPHSPQWILI